MRIPTLFYHLLLGPLLVGTLTLTYSLSQRGSDLWRVSMAEPSVLVLVKGNNSRDLFRWIADTGRKPPQVAFSAYARFAGIDRTIKTGRYRIPGEWSAVQILEQTSVGGNDPNRVTLPPGLSLPEVAVRLEDSGWIESATAWIDLASGPEALTQLGRPSYEGLVAPETYYFDTGEPPERVLETLRTGWNRILEKEAHTTDLDARTSNGLPLYDTIVLASVIEKEAAKDIERATVSSVFHNRIRKGWPLGSAATLRYALGDWSGEDRGLPVGLKSPYNTSRKPGLPPTPICLPSVASLRAALHPADTDYLFFVADGEGGLIFNKTHKEHRDSVSEYRKNQSQEN